MNGKRLLLVDGHSLANRAFYALPPFTNDEGVPTGAVYGFFTMLLRFLLEERPTHVAIAFDHPSPTFRHDRFTEYKATRKPSPDDFVVQIPILKRALDAFCIVSLELPGYEADDIIGTCAKKCAAQGYQVTILSGDKDCLQLVDDSTRVILPVKGISQVKEYGPEDVSRDIGVTPCQVVDMKALAGDASDNIPGVKGVGQKTALALLQQYGDIDSIYQQLDEVTPVRVRNLLASGKDAAFLSRELATIDTQAPLPQTAEEFEWNGPDFERSRGVFTDLRFSSLMERLKDFAPEGMLVDDGGAKDPHAETAFNILDTKQEIEGFLAGAVSHGSIAIYALPGSGDSRFSWPGQIGVSVGSGPCLIRIEGDGGANQETYWEVFQPILENPSIAKLGFDLKWLCFLCSRRGVALRGDLFDTAIAAYLLDPTRATYKLEDLVRKYAGIELPQEGEGHLALGADACFEVARKCRTDLEENGLLKLAEDIEFPLIAALADMEAVGVGCDLALGRSIRDEFARALEGLAADVHAMAGEEFNLDSPKQLSHILFEKLGLQPLKKTKTGFSTDAEVLEQLSVEHELPAKVLEYRQYAKLKSTYLDTLEEAVSSVTGRVHTTFHQTVTATGRLSSSDPNLQNIPVRGTLGRSLRRIFIPGEGMLFLASDYSQIELRIMAHISEDPTMIDAFLRGDDIHKVTASEMFGVPIDLVTDELRNNAKAVNFGIIYGISDYGLARNTRVSRATAKSFIDTYFERYPKVKEYMENAIKQARESGYASTILGRKRPVPEISSRIRAKRGFAERTAINSPIQGSAADIVKLAMVRIRSRIHEERLASRPILQVHDELIFEIPPSEEGAMRALVREEMEGAMSLRVPLKVDIDVGESWYDV